MRPRLVRRVLLALAVGGVAAASRSWGSTCLVLRSDWLLGQVDADPDSLFVAYTEPRASLVPGRIRFATLTLRSRDSNVEWEARLEDVTVDVALASLARRRFHAKVRACRRPHVPSARAARRESEATAARVARYPRIAGFTDPPLRDPPTPPAPPGDPWRVVVDDLGVGLVREIWIDSWRWKGRRPACGGLSSAPASRPRSFRASSPSGAARCAGERTPSRGRRPEASLRVARRVSTRRQYPGNEVWKIMSGAASLHGTLDGLAFLAPDGRRAARRAGRCGERTRAGRAAGWARKSAGSTRMRRAVVARLGERTLRGGVRADIFARRIDFPGGTVDFDGTRVRLQVRLTDGRRRGAVERLARGPRRARLGLADGSLDAQLSARLGDARPLVALVPLRPADVDRRASSTFATSRPTARLRDRSRSSRALAGPGRSRHVLDRRGLAEGPGPRLGRPSHPQGRPLPRGLASETTGRRSTSRAPPTGSPRKADPGGSGRISLEARSRACGPAGKPSRRPRARTPRRMGTARLRRGLSSDVQLRTSVFLIFAPSEPASSRTRLTESATCATVSPVRLVDLRGSRPETRRGSDRTRSSPS